ncbi:hypothetical protein [Achromobacter xylosoxidans]|uniref:hypothetical protein n=1 Tax=Alcaligenes xylosoxydans xylosoxydans TaxID=85698 RepID=UPI0028AB3237|nr:MULTISPECIES: hypothetical protein [Achromobacter]WOB74349.1 hypothetical protein PZA07_02380 [Achromobacter xylosoxidans]
MNLDFIRLANDMRRAHAQGVRYRLPAMTVRELGMLLALLSADVPSPVSLH